MLLLDLPAGTRLRNDNERLDYARREAEWRAQETIVPDERRYFEELALDIGQMEARENQCWPDSCSWETRSILVG